ncbi:MAG: hypothetical protein Tp1124SUR703682_43 [Prokaryotic dsDNA virus sp.]|nr:MAG: hypothetical protein Tp1124SUR703682_43 [Prokaryotic dsDNA virus sp.]
MQPSYMQPPSFTVTVDLTTTFTFQISAKDYLHAQYYVDDLQLDEINRLLKDKLLYGDDVDQEFEITRLEEDF